MTVELNFEMNKISLTAFTALVGYPIILFFVVQFMKRTDDTSMFSGSCDFGRSCLNFCCQKNSECTESYVRANFNLSKYYKNEYAEFFHMDDDEFTDPLKVTIGKPKCFLAAIAANWSFYAVDIIAII